MNIHFDTFEDEKILGSSDNNSMALTTHRIHYNSGSSFGGEYITMNLENISSIEVKYSSNYYLFILAGLGIIFTLFLLVNGRNNNLLFLSTGLSISFVLLYFYSRKKVISICSNGASRMNIKANNMSSKAISNYLDKIAKAKNERINVLNQYSSIHIN